MVNRWRRTRNDVVVIQVRRHPDAPPRDRADVDEFHHRIGPYDVVIDCILTRKHALRHALAHDNHGLAIPAIVVVEIATGNNRDAKRCEKSRRDGLKLWAWIIFAGSVHVPVRGVLKSRPGAELPRVTPRNRGAQSYVIHARKRFDATYRF